MAKKVYFLPYCAAMWRSLASLYQEHVKAGDDVTVMPIPYYGKDNHGALTFRHFDLHRFPVPTVDYKTVDLQEEHPDVIYIHNPYDGDNTITSVQPFFYSNKLKNYTDKLIYAPYYTTGGDIESAIYAPGVFNADVVITWSESQCERYKSILHSDKVIVKKYTPVPGGEIPEAWQEKMTGKKVVLYNNSIGALMVNPKKELEKVDRIIRQYSQDPAVCLWWRPHPLYVDTINALFPRYGQQYMKTLTRFAEAQTGIYDDTGDLERAVTACDEYIGSPSSLVKLFRDYGKPASII